MSGEDTRNATGAWRTKLALWDLRQDNPQGNKPGAV